jgi:hypothetical protein
VLLLHTVMVVVALVDIESAAKPQAFALAS